MKSCITAMLGIVIITSFIIILPITFIFIKLNSASTYKTALAKSELYSEAENILISKIQDTVNTQIEEQAKQAGADLNMLSIYKDDISNIVQTYVPKIVSNQLIQNTIENNIDLILSFVNNPNNRLVVYVPKEQLIQNIDENLEAFFADIRFIINNINECSVVSTSFCIEAEAKKELLSKFNNELANNFLTIIDELKKDNEIIKSSDNIDIVKVIENSEIENKDETLRNIEQLSKFQNYYSIVKVIFFVIVIFYGVLILIYFLNLNGNLFQKVRILSITLAIPLLVIAGIAFGSANRLKNLINKNLTIEAAEELNNIANQIINNLINIIIRDLGILAVILVAILTVVFLVAGAVKYKE